jgi:hypothetical protein
VVSSGGNGIVDLPREGSGSAANHVARLWIVETLPARTSSSCRSRRSKGIAMSPVLPVVSSLYAVLLALIGVVLTVRVILGRVRTGVQAGDGGDAALGQAIRAHANFTEQVPIALLVLVLVDVAGTSGVVVHVLGVALVVARLMHGLALSFGWHTRFGRVAGAAITFFVLLIEAALCLYQGVRGQVVWMH